MDLLESYIADRERLAAALRELRLAAGLTGIQAARDAGMSQPKISKVETGRLMPSVEDVRALVLLYRAEAERREELEDLAARLHASVESNRTILHRGAARRQADISKIEADSTLLRYFSLSGIPGLLQTAEYMRRVFALGLSGSELARAVAARQERQQALFDRRRRFIFLVTEAAMRWRFCPDEVMAAQFDRIASTMTLSNVDVGVIPFSARPSELPLHGFQLFDDRLVTIGLEHATVTVTEPQDIATYHRLFTTLSEAAEFGDTARARLAVLARDFHH